MSWGWKIPWSDCFERIYFYNIKHKTKFGFTWFRTFDFITAWLVNFFFSIFLCAAEPSLCQINSAEFFHFLILRVWRPVANLHKIHFAQKYTHAQLLDLRTERQETCGFRSLVKPWYVDICKDAVPKFVNFVLFVCMYVIFLTFPISIFSCKISWYSF